MSFENEIHNFDAYLKAMRADIVQHLAVRWSGNTRKRSGPEAKALLARTLQDPESQQALLAHLPDDVRAGLDWLAWLGGTADAILLRAALAASGHGALTERVMAQLRSFGISGYRHFDRLPYSYGRAAAYPYADIDPLKLFQINEQAYYADARLLRHASVPVAEPLILPHVNPGTADRRMRRPQTLALDLLKFFKVLQTIGGVRRLKTGMEELRQADVVKFDKAMGWDVAPPLDNMLETMLRTLTMLGAVEFDEAAYAYTAVENADAFCMREYAHIARWIFHSCQHDSQVEYALSHKLKLHSSLAGTLIKSIDLGLMALPAQESGSAFVSISDYADGLLARVHPGLKQAQLSPYDYAPEPPTQAAMRADFRLIVAQRLSGMSLYLGLVELVMRDGQPVAFRLTGHGKRALHSSLNTELAEPLTIGAAGKHWLVQPNYDMIVFLEEIDPVALLLAHRITEMRENLDHTATLRLTRESIGAALQRGMNIDKVIDMLADISRAPLPSNVRTELRNWAVLRENFVLQRAVNVLAFESNTARDAALTPELTAKGAKAIGDCYIVLPAGAHVPVGRTVDHQVGRAFAQLRVGDNGRVVVQGNYAEWYLAPLLDRCARRVPDVEGSWQFDAESVRTAGLSGAELVEFLNVNGRERVPKMISVALTNWARKRGGANTSELKQTWALRCANVDTYAAVRHSETLRSAIVSANDATRVIVFDAQAMETVRAVLRWAGISDA